MNVVPFIELIAPLFNVLGYRLVVREVKKVKTNGSTSQRFTAIQSNCQFKVIVAESDEFTFLACTYLGTKKQ